MPTKAAMIRDINGFNSFGLPFSDTGYSTTIVANAAQSLTIPNTSSLGGATQSPNPITDNVQKWLAVFSFDPGNSVWVALNTTATIPSSSFASNVSQLNPTARAVKGGDVLSFVSANTSVAVNVMLYALH